METAPHRTELQTDIDRIVAAILERIGQYEPPPLTERGEFLRDFHTGRTGWGSAR